MSGPKVDESQLQEFLQSLRDRSDPNKRPSYEGIDSGFHEEPRCAWCFSIPATKLLCCSRCHAAWYCNIGCQKGHYSQHKMVCLPIARNLKKVEQLAIPIRYMRPDHGFDDIDEEPEDFFETQVGVFSQWPETRAYLSFRRNLVNVYFGAAYAAEIRGNYEKALFHALEVQRLNAGGELNARYITPFLLLMLQRDDDAFDFIRYWIKKDDTDDDTITELMIHNFGTREGDWIYPRNKNCRFLDIFKECPQVDDRYVPLPFLFALLMIKCRNVAIYYATRRSIALAFDTTGGQRIEQVQDLVKDMLIDETMVNIDSQREQVERLMDVIHRNNPHMLPAIFNPLPFLHQECELSDVRGRGHPTEVSYILPFCLRAFLRVPGAEAVVLQRFGRKPLP